MCSHTNGRVAPTTLQRKSVSLSTESESWLEKLLMSRMFRRYVECLTVVLCPWVLLLEKDAEQITLSGVTYRQEAEGWEEYEHDPEL